MRHLNLWNDNSILTPWRGLMDLQRNLDRILDQAWEDARESRTSQEVFVYPACDVEETESHYVMCIDLPGVAKKDIHIEVKDGRLHVSAERKQESRNRTTTERYFGKFRRVLTLPPTVDAEKIEAQYQDGVLTLAVAKAETAKGRQIQITEGKTSFLEKLVGGTKETGRDKKASPVSAA